MAQQVSERVRDLIKEVPARRWLEYSKLFGRETTECMSDGVIAMVIVLNEEHRNTHGSPSLEKYLDMGLGQLTEEAQRVLLTEEDDALAGADGETFPGGGPVGGSVGGGVVADGPGGGLRDQQGPDLPVDGDPAQ